MSHSEASHCKWSAGSVSIHFDDPVKKELQFTGVFENESIQQALDALKLSGKFNYTIKGDEVIISK